MEDATETGHQFAGVIENRTAIAILASVLGTFAIFLGVVGLHPTVVSWAPSAVGLVGLEVPYGTYNDLWIVVRLLLGAYITVVLLIVTLQLVGTWRRLIADSGGES
jgi:hypothetical protein